MYHEYPYSTFYHDLDMLCACCKKAGVKLEVQNDYLRLINVATGEVISNVKIHYADTALTDIEGRAIKTYIFDASTDGTHIVFTHGDNTLTSILVPYSEKSKYDIDGKELQDYVYNVQVAGDKLRISTGDGTITEITVPFATAAATDVEGKDLTTYAATLEVDGTELVLRDSKGRQLSRITVAYATKALNDVDNDAIKSTYANSLTTGSTTVKLLAKDGTELSEITVPFATEATHATDADHADLADDATNAVESVSIVGDQMIFTTFGGAQYAITCPYSVKSQKDDLGNIIKSTYVANVTTNINTGELNFLDAMGNVIVTLVPTLDKAIHDSYNNLIADYVKQILVDSHSDYVTVTHGTGVSDSIKINYSEHAWCDTNEQVIKNTYITYLTCVEDVEDGHYKLVAWDGDIPKAELFRLEIYAYAAQTDVNGKALTSYASMVKVDPDDSEVLDVLDGEDNSLNQISGAVTVEPSGSVSATASGTAVTLTAGTLPSVSYDAATETLTFNAGAFPAVASVTDPSISASFTGDSETENIVFSDSL
jgi:predicted peroxiredoxin